MASETVKPCWKIEMDDRVRSGMISGVWSTRPAGRWGRRWWSALLLGLVWLSLAPSPAVGQSVADREQQARALFDAERYPEAADALRAILAAEPGNRTATILLPFALARAGSSGPAVEQARRALDRFPTNVKLQLLLAGLLSQQEGTRSEAIERYQRVLRANPDNRLARLGLAEAHRAQGRTMDAIQGFSVLAEREPNEPRYQVRLGQLYGSIGDLARARTYFERAYALGPSNREAVTSLAILGDVQDRPAEAVRYYGELLSMYPDDVSVQIAARLAKERASEPQFPMSIEEMEQTPLERYQGAVPENSKQLKQRREQIEATRWRSTARFLPSFFYSPSFGTVNRDPKPSTSDHSQTNSFSFGWNLADLIANPYKINITGMEADFEAVKNGLISDVTATYYQRRQSLLQYRQLQQALALDPQNAQVRQNKQTVKYSILTLTERLKLITGIP